MLRALPVLFGLLAAPAAAQPLPPPVIPLPVLAAELSVRRIEVTTAFTGGEILVFGATERLIHEGGDEVVVLASGPDGSLVVRRKVQVLGLWVNGPSARFNGIPSYWALAASRQVAGDAGRGRAGRAAARASTSCRWCSSAPARRASGRRWRRAAALRPLAGAGAAGRGFRRPACSMRGCRCRPTVATGEYRVQVMLVRERRWWRGRSWRCLSSAPARRQHRRYRARPAGAVWAGLHHARGLRRMARQRAVPEGLNGRDRGGGPGAARPRLPRRGG
jgi:hypothetical protein